MSEVVLDYPRSTEENSIVIPPFHTGHLGFIPGLKVDVGLMAPFPSTVDSDCELAITPLQAATSHLIRVECTMEDQPGVVEQLIRAVASLNVNIVSQQSYSIDHLKHHVTSMVLDWTTTDQPEPSAASPNLAAFYADYRHLFPSPDKRYILLFEQIVAYCCHQLAWTSQPKPLPSITFRPAEDRKFLDSGSATLTRDSTSKSLHVSMAIPSHLLSRIRVLTGRGEHEPLPYILLSSGEFKTLRAFFPRRGRMRRIIHVGFQHDDSPGAISTIGKALLDADFNIIWSLLRQTRDKNENIWEVVLEYRGVRDRELRGPADVADVVGASLRREIGAALHAFRVLVRHPMYPKQQSTENWPLGAAYTAQKGKVDKLSIDKRIQKTIKRLRKPRRRDSRVGHLLERERLLNLVSRRFGKPRIFLSYPKPAGPLVHLLRASLEREGNFKCDEYQVPDLRDITQRALDKISECDFFIGIWHHEEGVAGHPSISPWMHFELGVARALGKPTAVVYSDRLPERVWHRIEPGIAMPAYSEDTFESATIPTIVDYCNATWRVR